MLAPHSLHWTTGRAEVFSLGTDSRALKIGTNHINNRQTPITTMAAMQSWISKGIEDRLRRRPSLPFLVLEEVMSKKYFLHLKWNYFWLFKVWILLSEIQKFLRIGLLVINNLSGHDRLWNLIQFIFTWIKIKFAVVHQIFDVLEQVFRVFTTIFLLFVWIILLFFVLFDFFPFYCQIWQNFLRIELNFRWYNFANSELINYFINFFFGPRKKVIWYL